MDDELTRVAQLEAELDTERHNTEPCPSPDHRQVATIGQAYAGLESIKSYLDGAVRGQMPEVAQTVFGALSARMDDHDLETCKRLSNVEEKLDTLIALVTTLSEERLVDRQTIVELAKWKTAHERGNTHCETCPYQPAEPLAL